MPRGRRRRSQARRRDDVVVAIVPAVTWNPGAIRLATRPLLTKRDVPRRQQHEGDIWTETPRRRAASWSRDRINEDAVTSARRLKVQKVTRGDKEMYGLLATRDFKKCEALGVYDGEILTVPEFESKLPATRKLYAYESSILFEEDSDLRLVILPIVLPTVPTSIFKPIHWRKSTSPTRPPTSHVHAADSNRPDANPSAGVSAAHLYGFLTTRAISDFTLHYGNKSRLRSRSADVGGLPSKPLATLPSPSAAGRKATRSTTHVRDHLLVELSCNIARVRSLNTHATPPEAQLLPRAHFPGPNRPPTCPPC